MAQLQLEGGVGGFSWGIYGLQSNFREENYRSAGITERQLPSGGVDSLSGYGYVASVSTTDSGRDNNYTGFSWINYSPPGDYTFYGFAQAFNGTYYPAGYATVTVSGSEPDINVDFDLSSDSDSITVTVYVDSDAPYYKILCRKADGSGSDETIPYSGFDYHTSRYTETFTGLESDTQYYVNVQYSITGESNTGVWVGRQSIWTDPDATPSVADWTWYGTNETSISDHTNPASSNETNLARKAIKEHGSVSDFNHRVWNDMCFKCREILSALGYGHEGLNGWVNQYLSFDDTLMHTGNSVMTADRFNSLRYNIGVKFKVYWSFDPDTDIKKGKPVYGYYFTELTDAMNDWIDTL